MNLRAIFLPAWLRTLLWTAPNTNTLDNTNTVIKLCIALMKYGLHGIKMKKGFNSSRHLLAYDAMYTQTRLVRFS